MRCIALALIAAASPAMAAFQSGNGVVGMCDNGDRFLLYGYVEGAIDAFAAAGSGVCIPSEATAVQLTAIFCKFLTDNPDKWTWPASILVYNAQIAAFPCP